MPLVRRTRQTLRRAEFGFFGVVVYTRTQTPRRCGHDLSAGDAVLYRAASRPCRMSWEIVGMWMDDWGFEASETFVVTEGGAECLCSFPRELRVIA